MLTEVGFTFFHQIIRTVTWLRMCLTGRDSQNCQKKRAEKCQNWEKQLLCRSRFVVNHNCKSTPGIDDLVQSFKQSPLLLFFSLFFLCVVLCNKRNS